MGEHKGSGLSLMCELLGGALAGSGTAGPPRDQRFCNGMVSIYMSPGAFGADSAIAAETRAFVDYVRETVPAEAGSPVLLPGDPERLARQDRTAHGVPITVETLGAMIETARAVGLSDNDPRMLRIA
jgi:uncharacterized oxidoreductase